MIQTVRIEKSAFGGYGIAFLEGRVIFVPFTIPGELVAVTGITMKKDCAFAVVSEIIEASPDRIKPQCPVFMQCGGCDYLHMTYERELREKASIVEDSLVRIGKFPKDALPPSKLMHAERFRYRSHAAAKVSPEGAIGFFARDSHTIVPFPPQGCLLLDERLTEALRKKLPEGAEEIKSALQSDGSVICSAGTHKTITEEESGIRYERDIYSFFQANRYLRSRMIETALAYADLSPERTVLDAGCGAGFFTLPAALRSRAVSGIDISRESIAAAKKNAALNGISNVSFQAKPDDRIDPARDRADIVIADPPRAGLSAKTRSTLLKMNPQRIVYISCNPSTWARDLKDLTTQSHVLKEYTLIDMFPGTQHIEVISRLERK